MCNIRNAFLLFGVYFGCLSYANGAAFSNRPSRRLQQNNEYLPPVYKSDNYEDSLTTPMFQTSPQVPSLNSMDIHSYKPRTSYAPPPSGAASFQYSAPQMSNTVALSSLVPQSLLEDQFKPQPITMEVQMRQQYTEPKTLTPLLLTEEPASFVLTPNHNKTIEAAKLLASTLLDPNDETPMEQEFNNVPNTNLSLDPGPLNTTDVVIVKAQKNAYIIPKYLAKDARNPQTAQNLYEMREQLNKAYTINQFIFIIKPEKINFLNKLI